MDFFEGEVLAFDKPYEWTSFGIVAKVRWLLTQHLGRKIKVGHAGTLDPLATGVVLLCTGKATKRIEELLEELVLLFIIVVCPDHVFQINATRIGSLTQIDPIAQHSFVLARLGSKSKARFRQQRLVRATELSLRCCMDAACA